MLDNALVSIVMPTYNRAHLIGESIQSVIDQTYKHWELIVIDDGSSDDTKDVVTQFRDTRIQCYSIDHSGLVGIVRNQGIKKAKGEYIAFHDSDDLWRIDKLEFQLALFERHPEAKFVISNGEIFGSSSKSAPEYENLFVGSLFWPILKGNRFVLYTPSMILKRHAIDEVGLLDENMGGADMEFFLKLSDRFIGIFTNARLIKVRKHDQNTTDRYGIERYLSSIKMVSDFYKRGSLDKRQYLQVVSLYYYKMGLQYFIISRPTSALSAFWNYVKLVPGHWKGWARLAQAILLSIKP